MNDDPSKPVYLYCNFSVLKQNDINEKTQGGPFQNPCVSIPRKHSDTEYGKYEHILRPDQHRSEFVLIETDN